MWVPLSSQGEGTQPGSVISRFRGSLLGTAASQRFAAQQNRILFEDSGGRTGGPEFWEEEERGAAIRETIANFSPTRDVIAPALAGGLAAQGAVAVAGSPPGQTLLREFSGNVVLGFEQGQEMNARTGALGVTPAARIGFELGYAAGLSQSRLATGIRALLGP